MQEEESITTLNDYAKLRAEEIPKEELSIDDNHKRIHVAHFHKDYNIGKILLFGHRRNVLVLDVTFFFIIVQPHGNPFFLVIQKDEPLSRIKQRLMFRLGVTEDDIAKWRFAIVSFGRPEYLLDTDVVGKHDFSNTDYLGLEHPDTSSRSQYRHPVEKPIKIFG